MARLSRRTSRQSLASLPVHTLEHDATAVALQEALGARVTLIRAIGEGGMGRVYLARDPQLKRFVAVKVLLQSQRADAESYARFQREAQAIAAVSHPNVVAIYGMGELPDGTPYFIMQHVSGGNMAERLVKSGPLPIAVAEGVLGDVAAALSAAHKRGIVHRDIKPANVLWDEEGERATVSDFGIASLQSAEGEEGDIRITGSGMAVGSPAYMSPEQLLTEPITPKSDIYALGLLGYELLTARGPYAASKPSEIVAAHLRDTPGRLSEMRSDVPGPLEALLLRCLAKSPAERPNAEEVMLAMTPGAADALEWPPPGLERARGALWRLMLMPLVGTVLLLFPLLFLVKSSGTGLGEGTPVGPFVLVVSSLLGFVALIRGGARAWRAADALAQAARLGYGWGTLIEVMADRRGDSGSLIAGTREYGTLANAERARLRFLRVLRATLLFLAAPIALVAAIIALALRGGHVGGDTILVDAVLLPLLVLAASGSVAALYERARLASARHDRANLPRRTNEHELAPAWYVAFEQSREGQGFGRGRPVRSVVTALLVFASTAMVIVCAAMIVMTSVLVVKGQLWNGLITPSQITSLAYSVQRNGGGMTYRLPPDGRVTPTMAGEALLSIASANSRRPPSALEHAVSSNYPHWTPVLPSGDLFQRPKEMLWTSAAILAAGRGLTGDQRALLERAAAHPARGEFSRAAAAQTADLYGALLKLPLPEHINPASYPEVKLAGVLQAAESHAALVALDVADHRPADAERHAREIIAVGSMLVDLHFLPNISTGLAIVQRGVSALEAVYVATSREREARVLLDSVVAAGSREGRLVVWPGGDGLTRAMHDPRLLRGARLQMLVPILFRACADPKQLLFGTDDSYRRSVAYARDSLAHFPSERAFVNALDGMLAAGAARSDSLEPPAALMMMAETIDRVVGGKRFESCLSMTPVLGMGW